MSRRHFTLEDVRRINQSVIDGKFRDHSGLSPASQRILREATFTAEDFRRASAAAADLVTRR